jgi:mannose-6-phosphate isomerase-like protein (cupin superfamily)
MLQAGTRFTNPKTGASFEVLRAPGPEGRTLELRRVIKPGTGRTVPHVHMDFVERFVVESGQATARLGRRRVALAPAETLEVPPGRGHVNPYNKGTADLVLRHSFEPASDFALAYVETLGNLMMEGRADRQGEAPLTAAFAVAHLTQSKTFAAGLPHAPQTALLAPIGARIAKLRGYQVHLS